MRDLCTCDATRTALQREAARAGMKAKPRRVVIRVGDSEAHVGLAVAVPVLTALLVAAVIVAGRSSGAARIIALALAVLVGLWLGWTAILVGLMSWLSRYLDRLTGSKRR